MSGIQSKIAYSRHIWAQNGASSLPRTLRGQSYVRMLPFVLAVAMLVCWLIVTRPASLLVSYWSQPYDFFALGAIAVAALSWFLYRKRPRIPRDLPPLLDHRQELADSLPHVVWGSDANGRCEFLNERYTETFGISHVKAVREQLWADVIHPADRSKMYHAWRAAVDSGSSNYSSYARVRMTDGSYRWMESSGRSVTSTESGQVVRWFGSLVDVQSQVEDRETISRLQADLQTSVDEYEETLAVADERVRSVFEPRALSWIEYDVKSASPISDALRSNGVSNVTQHLALHPALAGELRKKIRIRRASDNGIADMLSESDRTFGAHDVEIAILAALINRAPSTCGMAELINADGKSASYPFSLSIADNGIAMVSFFDTRGFAERIEKAGPARRELATAHRIACASALSTSLVHEISQPITAITLDLATVSRLLSLGSGGLDAVAKVMERLRWNANRVAEIGTKTRDSLRPNRLNRWPVDIVDLAVRSRDLVLGPLDFRRGTVTITADTKISAIVADPVALKQVMCALLQNALEASESSGRPTAVSVEISRSHRATELTISVSDRGSGIREEHLPLAFDPFFSTKPNRLGFGLTVCQSIVEGFGGKLTLGNRIGGGVVAEFSIPVVDPDATLVSAPG
ncbi:MULTISPECIES: ATP-binding protein [unclassified Rhizobium]|uniref:ATP-binding protein n=1 Tax=unclassified Rhizobium TaxID=2613769 RepID=UPI001ADA944A|nr:MULTISPECIES: ATP-binding protein [unclassified Rhizobium]MBO9127988.1 PAS domain-containing protein [Rhizobium sp. 16-488-2b]MBO9178565.1 PAS domain-containing protein [Rhizobium sp. 16-488-2a]